MALRLVVVCTFAILGCEQCETEVRTGPPAVYLPVPQKDLGEIPIAPQGRTVSFPVVNRGLSELHITEVVVFCGCMSASVSDPVLSPGEQGTVTVVIAPTSAEERSTWTDDFSRDVPVAFANNEDQECDDCQPCDFPNFRRELAYHNML